MTNKFIVMIVLCIGVWCSCTQPKKQAIDKKVIIGYVPGFRGSIEQLNVAADKLTHINYAFVDVRDSMAWLTNEITDTVNFKYLVSLKRVNPELKILISVGGWSWSENFSDAVLTPSSRKKFAQSCVEIIRKHQLDGVDIDWEYPGFKGEDNVYRAEDKENFTLMFQAIREELDELTKSTQQHHLLTTAIPCFQEFIDKTEMGKLQAYLDFINLMSYDFYVNGDTAGHHTNLYPSFNYDNEQSGHRAYTEYTRAGVPAAKLVLGMAFYSRSWFMKSADNHGINRPVNTVTRGAGYTLLKDSIANRAGFTRFWDEQAKAAVLFNDSTFQMYSFDDEESIKHKCQYVMDHQMGGVMFWQYASDPKLYLLNAVNQYLPH